MTDDFYQHRLQPNIHDGVSAISDADLERLEAARIAAMDLATFSRERKHLGVAGPDLMQHLGGGR